MYKMQAVLNLRIIASRPQLWRPLLRGAAPRRPQHVVPVAATRAGRGRRLRALLRGWWQWWHFRSEPEVGVRATGSEHAQTGSGENSGTQKEAEETKPREDATVLRMGETVLEIRAKKQPDPRATRAEKQPEKTGTRAEKEKADDPAGDDVNVNVFTLDETVLELRWIQGPKTASRRRLRVPGPSLRIGATTPPDGTQRHFLATLAVYLVLIPAGFYSLLLGCCLYVFVAIAAGVVRIYRAVSAAAMRDASAPPEDRDAESPELSTTQLRH